MASTVKTARLIYIVVCASLLPASGCNDTAQPPESPVQLGTPGPVPAAKQRAGDTEIGYDILVNRGYVTCGIPYEAYVESRPGVVVEYQVPGRRGRNAELPYNLNATTNENGVELVVSNCLTCHGGVFNDTLVIGLGDAFQDFSADPIPGIETIGLFVDDGAPAEAWAFWADRIAAIAPYMRTDTFGVNPAPNLSMLLMARRNPQTLEWHDEPLLTPPPRDPLPVGVPPWWRMQKKHAMFYHGAGRGDHVPFMMLKSLVCTDDLDEARTIDNWFTHVQAYITSLEPPNYPYPVDRELAERGRPVFERNCAGCHGTYGKDWSYPNLIVSLDEVGTDPAYAEQAIEAERFIRWFNDSFYGQRAEARPAPGYVAPPLDAVWATAPYLHNDSIPSIAALLNSDARPTYWRHQLTPRDFDTDTLGWRYDVLSQGKDGIADESEARMIYDTTRRGYSNAGHTFGDALSDRERRALMEYLKLL